jgi:toxin ParE1/3/4
MAQKVIWTEPAREDLRSIYEYIKRDSDLYARSLLRELVAAANSLENFPNRGRYFPESPKQGELRELLIQSYRLVYRNKGKTVEILAVIHMSRDISEFGLSDVPLSPNS